MLGSLLLFVLPASSPSGKENGHCLPDQAGVSMKIRIKRHVTIATLRYAT
jgi:hypothetical protein